MGSLTVIVRSQLAHVRPRIIRSEGGHAGQPVRQTQSVRVRASLGLSRFFPTPKRVRVRFLIRTIAEAGGDLGIQIRCAGCEIALMHFHPARMD